MHLPLISFLTELLHMLVVNAVEGHGAVLAALLFCILYGENKGIKINIFFSI